MYIYNRYHPNVQAFIMYTGTDYNIMAHSPCLLYLPLLIPLLPLLPFLIPFFLLGTLIAVTGSVHLGLRLLVN
jgi:hypothetical protein